MFFAVAPPRLSFSAFCPNPSVLFVQPIRAVQRTPSFEVLVTIVASLAHDLYGVGCGEQRDQTNTRGSIVDSRAVQTFGSHFLLENSSLCSGFTCKRYVGFPLG